MGRFKAGQQIAYRIFKSSREVNCGGGIGCLDCGTERRSMRILLAADAVGVCRLCLATWTWPVYSDPVPVLLGPDGQTDAGDAAGGLAAARLLALGAVSPIAARRRRASPLLAPVFSWFTEGFEMSDLSEAKALLET